MLLFAGFFSAGAASLSVAILSEELVAHFTNKQVLHAAENSLKRLKSLNADYDVLLQQLDHDPNVLERIAPATLGIAPTDSNIVHPKVTALNLAAAREALSQDPAQSPPLPEIPNWLTRCNEPSRRALLFLAGAFLILISFIWFGSDKHISHEKALLFKR